MRSPSLFLLIHGIICVSALSAIGVNARTEDSSPLIKVEPIPLPLGASVLLWTS
jgi:hypothetical protein